MEPVKFTNSRKLTLAGQLFRAPSKSIIIMAHGMGSDKSSRGRFDKIAEVLHKKGYNILKFDFSGCGESADDVLTIEKEVDDLKSAIKFAKVKGYKKIALHGHSLGSLICLRCYSRAIKTMVLTGASTGPVKYNWSEYYSKDQLRELAGKGCMTARADSKWRKQIRVDKSLLAFFETINQKELLARVKCPVLIIHGNNKTDEEEKMLLANSKRGMKFLPPGSRLEIIEGAGHSLEGHLGEVLKLALEWYRGHLGI